MTKTASDRTTASSIAIVQEISEFSEDSNLQLASLAALLDQFGSAQKDKLSKLKTGAESAQKEFSDFENALGEAREARRQAEQDREDTRLALTRSQSDYQASQAELQQSQKDYRSAQDELQQSQKDYRSAQDELQQSQKDYRSAQDELQRVRAELEEATGGLAKEETARLALETDNVKLRDERQRLNGIVTAQQDDLKKLSAANVNIKRRVRHAAIAASVIVAVGLTTWFSGAHALFLAGH
jgi:chromosome segregation ATPase